MKRYYNYVFLDPRKPGEFIYEELKFDYEPIYIGKGTLSRMLHHLKDRLKKKSLFYNKLNKIIELGYEPIYFKINNKISEEEALQEEIKLISLIGRLDIETGTLCNCSEGGERGFNRTEETRKKMSECKKGEKNPQWGKKTSEAQKTAVKNNNKEKIGKTWEELYTPEVISNMKGGIKNRKIIKRRKDVKCYILTSPSLEEFTILGLRALQTFCKENKIQFQIIRYKIGCLITEEDLKFKNKTSKNTIGWKIIQV